MEQVEDLLWSGHNDGGELHPRPEDWQQARQDFEPAWMGQSEAIVNDWRQVKVNGNTINAAEKQLLRLGNCFQ